MSDAGNWRDYAEEYEPPKSMVGPLFIGILVQVALVLGARTQTGGFQGDWPLFLGQVVGTALPVPLVLWFAFMRQRDPRGWWKLPTIFLPLTFILMFGIGNLLPEGVDRDAELRKASSSIVAAGEEAIEKGPDIGQLRRSGATGEAGEVERITLGFMERIAADSRDYQRDIEASGAANSLTHPSMRSRAGIPAARAKVAAGRALIERYSRLIASRYASLPRQVEHAQISPRLRAEVMSGFSRNRMNAELYWSRLWGYEREAINTYDAMLNLLERTRWTRRGDLYSFSTTADSAAFNRLADTLERIGRDEEALDAAQQARAREIIGRARRNMR